MSGCGRRLGGRTSFRIATAVLLGAVAASPAEAQHEGHPGYADTGSDTVKTLTPEEVSGLLEGAGMGMARPAELNGYPGPRHVLELADSLSLSPDRRRAARSIFESMQQRARALGRQIVETEKELDAAFARDEDPDSLRALVTRIGELEGELRWTHLEAHLRMADELSRHQRMEYDRLRGYGGHGH